MASSSKHTGPHDFCERDGLHEHDISGPYTLVEYMYRDASNYKQHGKAFFKGAPEPNLVSRLHDAAGVEFNPDQVGLANLRDEMASHYHYDDDSDIHEITDVESISYAIQYGNDERTFEEFVRECEAVDEWHKDTEAWERLNSPHIILTGDPMDGFSAWGPFPTRKAAEAHEFPIGNERQRWFMPVIPAGGAS